MAAVRAEPVELQTAAVDLVVQLFGDIGHVGRQIEGIAAAAELMYMVILGCQPRIRRSLVVGTKSDRLGIEFRNVRKAVAVTVVGVAHSYG